MDYFVARDGQQVGPFPVERLIAEGVTPETLVWCNGMERWTPAKHVAEIAPLFSQTPQQPAYGPQPAYQQPVYGPQPAYGPYRPDVEKTMGFTEALKTCFSKYADFSGRARRSEYWYFALWFLIISIFTCGIGYLVLLIPAIAVGVRRLHDTGRSGWWYVANMLISIPYSIVNFMVQSGNGGGAMIALMLVLALCSLAISVTLLVFTLSDSQPGDNQYGPNPKY